MDYKSVFIMALDLGVSCRLNINYIIISLITNLIEDLTSNYSKQCSHVYIPFPLYVLYTICAYLTSFVASTIVFYFVRFHKLYYYCIFDETNEYLCCLGQLTI